MKIVAEIGGNHGGSKDKAMELIQAAKDAGADMVKFQVWTPSRMLSPENDTMFHGRRLSAIYEEIWTDWEWLPEMFYFARDIGIEPFASVFDTPALRVLEDLNCTMYKVASPEVTDTPLFEAIMKTHKPIVFSNGLATHKDLDRLVQFLPSDSTCLVCVSEYPAEAKEYNLGDLATLHYEYGWRTGLSDHTAGIGLAVAAASRGAQMIEKHLCLGGGVDAEFALTPKKFGLLVQACREANEASQPWEFNEALIEKHPLRRRLFWAHDRGVGHKVEFGDMVTYRGKGEVLPKHQGYLAADARLVKDVHAGDPVRIADYALAK